VVADSQFFLQSSCAHAVPSYHSKKKKQKRNLKSTDLRVRRQAQRTSSSYVGVRFRLARICTEKTIISSRRFRFTRKPTFQFVRRHRHDGWGGMFLNRKTKTNLPRRVVSVLPSTYVTDTGTFLPSRPSRWSRPVRVRQPGDVATIMLSRWYSLDTITSC